MSKNNVNPSHYKVAGRERQGEDIAQELNKQKLAESAASRRTEPGAGTRHPAAQEAASLPHPTDTSSQKLAPKKAGSDVQEPGKRTKRSTDPKG